MVVVVFFSFFFLRLTYLFQRERKREGGSRGRGSRRKSPSRLPTKHGAQAGLDPTTHEIPTGAETKSPMPKRRSHSGAPHTGGGRFKPLFWDVSFHNKS